MLTGRRGSKQDEKPKGRKSLKDLPGPGGDGGFSLLQCLQFRPGLYAVLRLKGAMIWFLRS